MGVFTLLRVPSLIPPENFKGLIWKHAEIPWLLEGNWSWDVLERDVWDVYRFGACSHRSMNSYCDQHLVFEAQDWRRLLFKKEGINCFYLSLSCSVLSDQRKVYLGGMPVYLIIRQLQTVVFSKVKELNQTRTCCGRYRGETVSFDCLSLSLTRNGRIAVD